MSTQQLSCDTPLHNDTRIFNVEENMHNAHKMNTLSPSCSSAIVILSGAKVRIHELLETDSTLQCEFIFLMTKRNSCMIHTSWVIAKLSWCTQDGVLLSKLLS